MIETNILQLIIFVCYTLQAVKPKNYVFIYILLMDPFAGIIMCHLINSVIHFKCDFNKSVKIV